MQQYQHTTTQVLGSMPRAEKTASVSSECHAGGDISVSHLYTSRSAQFIRINLLLKH